MSVELFETKTELEALSRHYIHTLFMQGGYYGEQRRNKYHNDIANLLDVQYADLKGVLSYLEVHIKIPLDELNFDTEQARMEFIVIEYGGKLYEFLKSHLNLIKEGKYRW